MAPSRQPLKHIRIAVTGASRGFGRALSAAYWRAGADLVLLARSAAGLEALADELRAVKGDGQQLEVLAIDLADRSRSSEALAGRDIHVLVNNAAAQGPIGPLWEADFDAWRRTVELDLVAPAALCRAVLPGMIRRGSGSIINISGGGAASARPNFSAYAAAKAGLVRLTECLAAEAAPYGVSVTAVAPGVMPTGMLEEVVGAGRSRTGDDEFETARDGLEAGEEAFGPAIDLCLYLAERPRPSLRGRLIAARWDSWRDMPEDAPDLYMLRRIGGAS